VWLILTTEAREAFRQLAFREGAALSGTPLASRLSPGLMVPAAFLAASGYVAWRAWANQAAASPGLDLFQQAAWGILAGVELLALAVGVIGAVVGPTMLRAETEHLLGLPVSRTEVSLARLLHVQVESAAVFGVLALPALTLVSAPAAHVLARGVSFQLVGLVAVVTVGYLAGAAGRLAWSRLAAAPPAARKVAVGVALAVVAAAAWAFLGQPSLRVPVGAWMVAVLEHLPASLLVRHALEGRLGVLAGAIAVLAGLTATAVLLGAAVMRAEAMPPRPRVRASPPSRSALLRDVPGGGLFLAFLLKDLLQYRRNGRGAFTFAMFMIMALMLALGGAEDPRRGQYFLWSLPLVIAGQYVLHAVGQEGTNLALVRVLFPAPHRLLAAKYASGLVFTAATGSLVYLAWQAVAALTGTARPDLGATLSGLGWLALLSVLATAQALAFGTLYADLRVKRLAPQRGCSGFGEMMYWIVGGASLVVLQLLSRAAFQPPGLLLAAAILVVLTLATLAGASGRLNRLEG
jgi:hypothetical protein